MVKLVFTSAKIYNSDETAKGNAIFIPEKTRTRYSVTVLQFKLGFTTSQKKFYIYIYINIYIDIEVFYTPRGNYFWNCNTVTL